MALIDVQHVIGRVATNKEFRELLAKDPEKALAGYKLTAEERKVFKDVSLDSLKNFSKSLQSRMTRKIAAYNDQGWV